METIKKLLKMDYKAHLKNYDSFYIVTGDEGKGKSNLVLDITDEWEKITNDEVTIQNVALTQQQWVRSIKLANPKTGITVFDEAGDGLLSRDSMSDFNKDVIKMYIVIRGKCLMSILVLPSFWYLDRFFRQHRVKGLFHVYARGKVAFWNKKQIRKMIMYGEERHDMWCVKPTIYDTFPKYNGKLLKEYLERKGSKINFVIDDMDKKYSEPEQTLDEREKFILEKKRQGMTYKEIAQTLNEKVQQVNLTLTRMARRGVKIHNLPPTNQYNTNIEPTIQTET